MKLLKKHKKQKKFLQIIMVKKFGYFFMLGQTSLQPQVKESVITSNEHGISEFCHDMPNDARLRILRD